MTYRNAPIVEAVIDLRVRSRKPPSTGALRKFGASLGTAFPSMEEIRTRRFEVNLNKNPDQPKSSDTHLGFMLRSESPARVFQIRVDGFSYSHLAPYSNWDVFSGEAKKYWELYKDSFRPQEVERIAIRTINRIVLPVSTFKLEKYFRLYPQLGGDPNEAVLTGFFMQLQLPQEDVTPDTGALVNFSSGERDRFDVSSIVFDIDLFSRTAFVANDAEVWKLLEKLRVRRNDLFESSITDATRSLFE